MSLFIEVYVGSKKNRKLVGHVHAYNDSDLASTSDYNYLGSELGYSPLGIPPKQVTGRIEKHRRDQSVWSLVEKIAKGIQE